MQTPQALGSARPVRAPRRFVSIGLVAALHVVVIYGLLVGINVAPNPFKRPPIIDIKFINKTRPVSHAPPLPRGPTLAHPTAPPIPLPPPLDFGDSAGASNAITNPPPAGGGSNVASGPTVGPLAMANTHTIPPYPPMGIRLGHEGTVRLAIQLDEQGNVIAAQVIASSGYEELDAAAVAWVKSHWRYQPAMRDGQPVPATTRAAVTFRLNQIRG